MVSKSRVTLSEEFKEEAIGFVNDLRADDADATQSEWLEDIIPTLTQEEKQEIYEAYDAGVLSEGATHVLLGDGMYAVEEAIEEMEEAVKTATSNDTSTKNVAVREIATN